MESAIEKFVMAGPGSEIAAFVNEGGRVPLERFLERLHKKQPTEFYKMQALLDRVKDQGPQKIRNQERSKHLGNDLFEFKAGSIRIFWIYGSTQGLHSGQRKVVLLFGVIKKRGRHRNKDIERAKTLKASYEERRIG